MKKNNFISDNQNIVISDANKKSNENETEKELSDWQMYQKIKTC